MTVHEALLSAQKQFQAAGIDSHWLDAEILLAFTLKQPREYLTAHATDRLSHVTIQQFGPYLARRARNEPVAYITGEKEFYGLKFKVTPDVLIPRPATEELIGKVIQSISHLSPVVSTKKRLGGGASMVPPVAESATKSRAANSSQGNSTTSFFENDKKIIIDIGTGSGCIAITLAKYLPDTHIIATDISESALAVARTNAQTHNVSDHITFLHGSLLEPLMCHPALDAGSNKNRNNNSEESAIQPFAIVANLPYVPTNVANSKSELRFEPKTALDGGPDGTLLYRRLLNQINQSAICNLQSAISLIALEIEPMILNTLLSAPEFLPFAEDYTITHTPHTLILTRQSN